MPPTKHVRAHLDTIGDKLNYDYEFYYRCRLLQDFVSGMTDQSAYEEYRMFMVSEQE